MYNICNLSSLTKPFICWKSSSTSIHFYHRLPLFCVYHVRHYYVIKVNNVGCNKKICSLSKISVCSALKENKFYNIGVLFQTKTDIKCSILFMSRYRFFEWKIVLCTKFSFSFVFFRDTRNDKNINQFPSKYFYYLHYHNSPQTNMMESSIIKFQKFHHKCLTES